MLPPAKYLPKSELFKIRRGEEVKNIYLYQFTKNKGNRKVYPRG